MKRIFLVCFLLTATCSMMIVEKTQAQITVPPTVTLADFTAKINLMDSYIAGGSMTLAQSTWLDVHNMMLNVLATSKYSINTAATPADRTAHIDILNNQRSIYRTVWLLKPDLATNRAAIHAALVNFGATIY